MSEESYSELTSIPCADCAKDSNDCDGKFTFDSDNVASACESFANKECFYGHKYRRHWCVGCDYYNECKV